MGREYGFSFSCSLLKARAGGERPGRRAEEGAMRGLRLAVRVLLSVAVVLVASWGWALGGLLTPPHRPTATGPALVTAAAAAARPSHADEPLGGLSREEWGQIRELVEKDRYHAASVAKPGEPAVLKASNPKQGYVTTFRPQGIEITSRPVLGTDWRLGVRVTGFGPEGDVRPLPVAKPVGEKERVEYRRGPVTEWYENRPGGLEQGFTIAEPETRERQPLVLEMAVEGGLAVRLEGADEASFKDDDGWTVVRYAGLRAWDADDRALASWLEVSEGQLHVLVEAREARFPVTVDPTFVQEAKLTASDGAANDSFGMSVAVSGNTALIGAYWENTAGGTNAGSAYVFVRSGTVWSEQQKLTASDGAASDYFGYSVSVSGDTALVGAPYDDTAGGVDAGSAYVFLRSGTEWTQQQKLTASDGAAYDIFGVSVSISGDTAVVGAPGDDTAGGADAGSAYVFVRTGSAWSQQQKLTASDGTASDYFGMSVSVSGDTAVVGAPYDDTGGGTDAGSAYVFLRSGTVWTQQQKLAASDGAAGEEFGWSVSVSGETAVVGAPFGQAAPGVYGGSAYVFVGSGTVWSEQQKLTAPDGAADDWFGWSVSLSGDTAVIGAPGDDTAGGVEAGSAYVFRSVSIGGADLGVTLSDAPDPVSGLGSVTYTVGVSNAGPDVATSVQVVQSITSAPSTGATFQGASGAGWSCSAGATSVTCTQASLASGASAPPLTIQWTVGPEGGTVLAQAVVSATEPDPQAANNTAYASTTVTSVPYTDLSISKNDGGVTVLWNRPITYTLTVGNAGPGAATGAMVVDSFPASVSAVVWLCAASVGSSCPASGSGTINATVNLAVGGTVTFIAAGTVVYGTVGPISNTATVNSPIYDTNAANNSSTINTPVDGDLIFEDGFQSVVEGWPET